MSTDAARSDAWIREAFLRELEATAGAVPDLTSSVLLRLHAPRRRFRTWTTVLVAAAVVVGALAAGAEAISPETMLIHIEWRQVPLSGQARSTTVTGGGATTTDIAGASRLVGFSVQPLNVPGARLDRVTYMAPITSVDGKPVAHNTGAAVLDYTLPNGRKLQIGEQYDTQGPRPLHIVIKQPPPGTVTDQNEVEVIDGKEYLITRTPDGFRLVSAAWKLPDGRLYRINVMSDPVDLETMKSYIQGLS